MKQTVMALLLCLCLPFHSYTSDYGSQMTALLLNRGKAWNLIIPSDDVCGSYKFMGTGNSGKLQTKQCTGRNDETWALKQNGAKNFIIIGNTSYELQFIRNKAGEVNMIWRSTIRNYQGTYPSYAFR